MNEVWGNPANWTTEQWIAVSIMAFVIVAILVLIHRLLTIVKISKKQQYKPNLRRLRKTSAPTGGQDKAEQKSRD